MPDMTVLLQSKSWPTSDASSRFLLVDEELLPAAAADDEPPAEDDPSVFVYVACDPAGLLALAGCCAPEFELEEEPDD